MPRLALGTAQFGLNYGLTNPGGITPPEEVAAILSLARTANITTLDTAPHYGEAERLIAESLTAIDRQDDPTGASIDQFRMITKLTSPPGDGELTAELLTQVESQFYNSLHKLKRKQIYGLLLHEPHWLYRSAGQDLYTLMQRLKSEGLVEKIGVSLYEPEERERYFNDFDFDLVQFPLNIFDRRYLENDFLNLLKNRGIEIQVRSVFLQGLLLLSSAELSPHHQPLRESMERYHRFIRGRNLTPVEAALGFALSFDKIDEIVVGVNRATQLRELLRITPLANRDDFKAFALNRSELVDPSRWERQAVS